MTSARDHIAPARFPILQGSVHAKLKARDIRLVVAEVMEDVKAHARYRLNEIFGDDAFYDRLEDVVKHYRQQFNVAAPSQESDPTPGGVDRSA
jgi:hypothetical protein